jgi:cytoskeletal protein CcmA (bactofilin family)
LKRLREDSAHGCRIPAKYKPKNSSMKTRFFILALALFSWAASSLKAAEPRTGDQIEITSPIEDNLYLAGEDVLLSAAIQGDVIAACSELSVQDTLFGDLLAATSEAAVNAPVQGDLRLFTGVFRLNAPVGGDLIVFGGEVTLSPGTSVGRDLIVFGGKVSINGTVQSDLRVYGGEVEVNGTVEGATELRGGELRLNGQLNGDAILAGEQLKLGQEASIAGDVRYWAGTGEMDFGPVARNPQWDSSLRAETGNGFGGWGFFLFSFLSSVLLALLLIWLLGPYFSRSARHLEQNFFKSFAFGVLYVIAVPVGLLVLAISLIGLPLSFLGGSFYLFTLVFAPTLAAVLLAFWLDLRYEREWGRGMLLLISVGIFLALTAVLLIPFLGWLIGVVVIGGALGALVQGARRPKDTPQDPSLIAA